MFAELLIFLSIAGKLDLEPIYEDRVTATVNSRIITEKDLYHECFVTLVSGNQSSIKSSPKQDEDIINHNWNLTLSSSLKNSCKNYEAQFLELSIYQNLIYEEIIKFNLIEIDQKKIKKHKNFFFNKLKRNGLSRSSLFRFSINIKNIDIILKRRLFVDQYLKKSAQFQVFVSDREVENFTAENSEYLRDRKILKDKKQIIAIIKKQKKERRIIQWIDELKTRNQIKIFKKVSATKTR